MVAGRQWQNVVNGQQNQLSSAQLNLDQAQPGSQLRIFQLRHDVGISEESSHTPSGQDWYPSFQSLDPRRGSLLPPRVCRQRKLLTATRRVRTCAVCTKYRYWLHACREGLHHQTSTNPPPITKANATPGGPTPTIEARHLQFISTLVPPGCPVLVCRRPCVSPGPHHQLTDELPHLSRQTHAPPLSLFPGHLVCCSPPVPFNSSHPVIQSPQSLPHSHSLSGPLPAFLPVCRLHTPPTPLNPWLAPAFAASACAASLHMLLVRDCPRALSTAGLLRDSTKPPGLDWLGPWKRRRRVRVRVRERANLGRVIRRRVRSAGRVCGVCLWCVCVCGHCSLCVCGLLWFGGCGGSARPRPRPPSPSSAHCP